MSRCNDGCGDFFLAGIVVVLTFAVLFPRTLLSYNDRPIFKDFAYKRRHAVFWGTIGWSIYVLVLDFRGLQLWGKTLCLLALLGASLVDIKHRLIPDRMELVGLTGALLLTEKSHILTFSMCCLALALLFLLSLFYEKIFKRESMGHGDFKLLVWMCIGTGSLFQELLFLSLLLCAAFFITRSFLNKDSFQIGVPFAPFLTLSMILMDGVQTFLIWTE